WRTTSNASARLMQARRPVKATVLSRALDLNGLYFLIVNDHVLALGDLVAAHRVLPRDDLASFRIDVLLFQPSANGPVCHPLLPKTVGVLCAIAWNPTERKSRSQWKRD